MSFQIDVEKRPTDHNRIIHIITPSGEFNLENTTNFKEKIKSQINQKDINKIVLNLVNINFISDYAIAVIICTHRLLEESGGKMHLCLLQDRVLEAFEYNNLDKIISIYNNLDDAIASLN